MDTLVFYLADSDGHQYPVAGFVPGPVIEDNGARYQEVSFTTPIIGVVRSGMKLRVFNRTLRTPIGALIVDCVLTHFDGERKEQIFGRLIVGH